MKTGRTLAATLLTESISEHDLPVIRYYGQDLTTDGRVVAVAYVAALPDSTTSSGPAGGMTHLVMTVAESGAPSRFLKAFQKLYGDNKGEIEEALVDAAVARLSLD